MSNAKVSQEWNYACEIVAAIHNANCGSKENLISAADIHPSKANKKPKAKDKETEVKQVPVAESLNELFDGK